jgi:dienelactone hydrolase
LVLTDIFGKNYLSEKTLDFSNIIVLDPYSNENLFFEDEKEAYETFLIKSGHEKYFQKAYNLCQEKDIFAIIGFSAGATVAWRLSSLNTNKIKQIFCFYPSQIRNHMEITPSINTNIILAKKEASFNTKEISSLLSKKEKVSVEVSENNHGFMNKKSKNYSKKAFDKYFQYLIQKLN